MIIYPSLPELRGATFFRDYFSKNPLHIHCNLELNYCLYGVRRVILGGKEYKIEPGGLLMIFPYQLHEYPDFSLDTLANAVGMSRRTVSRFFNDRMEISFPKFISMLRLHRSIELMREGHSVMETAMICGFGSIRSFNRVFVDEYGMAPREYIRQVTDNSRK